MMVSNYFPLPARRKIRTRKSRGPPKTPTAPKQQQKNVKCNLV